MQALSPKEYPEQSILPKKISRAPLARNTLFKQICDNWMFYLCIAPFFILFGIFGAYPIIASFYYSFTQWDGLSDPVFVGLSNYATFFSDPDFFKVLYNTFFLLFFSTVITLFLAFVLAFLVQHYIQVARTFFRLVFLFPLLVAPSLTALMMSVIFATHSGLMNTIISFLIGHQFEYDWFYTGFWLKPLIILLVVWRWTGWYFILFLSGLQTIPAEMYEAARTDGARGRQILFSITIPLMMPVFLVTILTATIGGLQMFDEPYVLTNGTGGTLQAGTTLGLYQYQTAFQQFHFGQASAISYVIFIITLIFSFVNFRLVRKRS